MYPWGDTPAATAYAVGDKVRSGESTGHVVSVDGYGHVGIVWSDGDGGAITYPVEAGYIERAMPWES